MRPAHESGYEMTAGTQVYPDGLTTECGLHCRSRQTNAGERVAAIGNHNACAGFDAVGHGIVFCALCGGLDALCVGRKLHLRGRGGMLAVDEHFPVAVQRGVVNVVVQHQVGLCTFGRSGACGSLCGRSGERKREG